MDPARTGAHTCLGQQLARSEMRVSIERILDRSSNVAIDEDRHGPAGDRRFGYATTSLFRGLTHLHLTMTPGDDDG